MPEQPVSEPAADTPPPPEAAPQPEAGPADDAAPEADSGKFTVRLTNFTGPFDLLLQLIGKHKLDVTEIALHQVTDDFIAYIRAMGDDWDLGETSEFLLVAATLLDLKAARLLPSAEVEDEDDLALLEAGDLLFARLLQYKAYKEAAAVIADLEGTGAKRWPRAVSLEPRYAEALPDLVLGIGPERLLKLALKQFLPKPGPPEVSIAHIHQVRVSVREHATLIRDRLRRAGSATFSLLIADCENTLEVVARFLALLELYREGLIDFEQPVSLEEMTVRWIGGDQVEGDLDIDDYEGTPPEPDTAAMDPDDPSSDPSSDPDPDPGSGDPGSDLDGSFDLDGSSDLDGSGDFSGFDDLDGSDGRRPMAVAEETEDDDDADLDAFDVPDFDDGLGGRDAGASSWLDPGDDGADEAPEASDSLDGPDSGPTQQGAGGHHTPLSDVSDLSRTVDAEPGLPEGAAAEPVEREGSASAETAISPAGHRTADRVSTDEEQS
ncbi:hypothetical protein GCM10020358_49640 [Amorphoplanes nipponensis]|uniref:Segregation and condensation protein A n=1 Tax=Actinoplanes nipponensis TaxID=135950 RepID=A0A919JM46_9ACTN|nr:hypothetical protein Ani05nite_66450 [Actinoplanes nipponensis]